MMYDRALEIDSNDIGSYINKGEKFNKNLGDAFVCLE